MTSEDTSDEITSMTPYEKVMYDFGVACLKYFALTIDSPCNESMARFAREGEARAEKDNEFYQWENRQLRDERNASYERVKAALAVPVDISLPATGYDSDMLYGRVIKLTDSIKRMRQILGAGK